MVIFKTIALLVLLPKRFHGSSFMIPGMVSNHGNIMRSTLRSSKSEAGSPVVDDDDVVVVGDDRVSILKAELVMIAGKTNRGFQASRNEQSRIKEIIFQLQPLNPTAEPASSYYEGAASSVASDNNCNNDSTLTGKWTLLYSDAPDITSLDTSQLPFGAAQLGRIGQECSPPYIKNVIEWKKPDWACNLPLSGSDDSRILQKVVTSATASPDKPKIINLKVAGLELCSAGSSSRTSTSSTGADLQTRIKEDGLIGGLLGANPVDLKGPWNPPFGQFEILYLDKEFRIIKTYQNYLAVNRRIDPEEEWF